MILLILLAIVIAFILYKRHFPVIGLPSIPLEDIRLDKITLIDVRDYNESYKAPINGAFNIPIPYFKRNVKEIPNDDLHLIVTSSLEKNIATRCLRKRGFRVVSFTNIKQNELNLIKTLLNLKINC